ncbi:MAG: hypothetical protein RLZZ584_1726, partial [Pseudomonadota bacterium]
MNRLCKSLRPWWKGCVLVACAIGAANAAQGSVVYFSNNQTGWTSSAGAYST